MSRSVDHHLRFILFLALHTVIRWWLQWLGAVSQRIELIFLYSPGLFTSWPFYRHNKKNHYQIVCARHPQSTTWSLPPNSRHKSFRNPPPSSKKSFGFPALSVFSSGVVVWSGPYLFICISKNLFPDTRAPSMHMEEYPKQLKETSALALFVFLITHLQTFSN